MSSSGQDVPVGAIDPTTKDIIGWIGKILYWISYPIAIALYHLFYYVVYGVLFVVRTLYKPLAFILAPTYYLIRFLFDCFMAPFRFLAKFETIYIYLGIAALVGITGGLLISFIYGLLQKPLGLDPNSEPTGRTAKQYRSEKRKQKAKTEMPLSSFRNLSPNYLSLSDSSRKGQHRNKGVVSQTILEEMDSDE